MNPFDTLNAQIGGLGLRGRPRRPEPIDPSEVGYDPATLTGEGYWDTINHPGKRLPIVGAVHSVPADQSGLEGYSSGGSDITVSAPPEFEDEVTVTGNEPGFGERFLAGLDKTAEEQRREREENWRKTSEYLDQLGVGMIDRYNQFRQNPHPFLPPTGRALIEALPEAKPREDLLPGASRQGAQSVPPSAPAANARQFTAEGMPDFSGVTSGASSSTGRNVGAAPYEAAPVTGYAPRATTPPDEAFIEYAPGIRVALGGVRMGNEDLSGLRKHAVNYRDFEPPPDITAIEGAMQMRRQQDEQRLRDAQVRRAEAEAADPQGIGRIRAQFAGQNALQQQAQASALERATAVTNARAAQQEDIRVRADMLRQQYENRARALQQEMSQLRPSENPLDAAKFEAVRSALANETTTFNQRMRLLNPAFIDRGADLAYDEITFPEAP